MVGKGGWLPSPMVFPMGFHDLGCNIQRKPGWNHGRIFVGKEKVASENKCQRCQGDQVCQTGTDVNVWKVSETGQYALLKWWIWNISILRDIPKNQTNQQGRFRSTKMRLSGRFLKHRCAFLWRNSRFLWLHHSPLTKSYYWESCYLLWPWCFPTSRLTTICLGWRSSLVNRHGMRPLGMVISLVGDGDFLGMFIPPWKTISKSNGSHDLYVSLRFKPSNSFRICSGWWILEEFMILSSEKCTSKYFCRYVGTICKSVSGQIITTSAEVILNCGLVSESPKKFTNSGLGIIVICPDVCML